MFKKPFSYREVISNTTDMIFLFENSPLFRPLTESEKDKIEDVRIKIQNDIWDKNPLAFFKSFIQQKKHAKMLTPYEVDDFKKMETYKVPGYNIGFALKSTPDGKELVAVHNAEPEIRGIGDLLVKAAIQKGAEKLDHFDTEALSGLYSKAGFEEYHRDPYDPQYDLDGTFRDVYGETDVVYRRLKR